MPLIFSGISVNLGTGYLFSSDIMVTMERYRNGVAECVIDEAKKLYKELNNVKADTRIEHEDPRDVICEVAGRSGVDIVVMGSNGYSTNKRLIHINL
ncbi:hypothetical protein RJ640_013748 [Escallonia rubra]|uniref:UspA domain-containing protein n=1 Tax=Escallonia rubra TaxID=112253 RepID=A0AA88QQK0_9ASTE|nr:hypothetical protein RJ640_013748 [Escallonia rubra]